MLEIEFDRKDGVDLFEVELDDGADVKHDTNTGEIIGAGFRADDFIYG